MATGVWQDVRTLCRYQQMSFRVKFTRFHDQTVNVTHITKCILCTGTFIVCIWFAAESPVEWLFHTVIVMPDSHCLIIRLEGETQMLTPTRWADSFRAVTPPGEMRKWDGGRK